MKRLNKQEDQNFTFLRDFYKKKLKQLSEREKREKSKKINKFLFQLPFLTDKAENSYIAFYRALETEPCLLETYSKFQDKACFPVVEGDKLEFYTNPENQWKKGLFQIEEPFKIKKNKVSLEKISLFFIPGICFDRQSFRLGKGFGYYDKTLSEIKKTESVHPIDFKNQTIFMGVSFVDQIHNQALPIKNHDVRMDFLVTNQFVLCPLKKRKYSEINTRELSIKSYSF